MPTEIRLLLPSDTDVLSNVAPGAFDNPIDKRAAQEFLSDDHHHIAVAIDDVQVVGFVSAVHYLHPDKPSPELWINEVQVAPRHRRQGLARAMLDEILMKARELGCTEAWVLTDVDNSPAKQLYMSAGGVEEPHNGVMYTFQLQRADGKTAATGTQKGN
jgi:aminoglycoside 6'-N-acetyltransferase I